MQIGPFFSYKNVFKRKAKIFKLGDISIPLGMSFEQFAAVLVSLIITLILYLTVPFINRLNLTHTIILFLMAGLIPHVVIDRLNFRGMGLLNAIITTFHWLFTPKQTLFDQPIERNKPEQISHTILTGYKSYHMEEIIYLKNAESITLEGSLKVILQGDFMYVIRKTRPYRKSSIILNQELLIRKKGKKIIKLANGVHNFKKLPLAEGMEDKKYSSKWEYILS